MFVLFSHKEDELTIGAVIYPVKRAPEIFAVPFKEDTILECVIL